MIRFAVVSVALLLAPAMRADLSSAKAQPKPEKRAQLAMENADAAFKAAQDAYLVKGDLQQTNTSLAELGDSISLAYTSLKETGKNPSRSPKYFKRAEIKTRELLRKLTDFRDQMSALDRDELDKVRAAIQKVHDDLLAGIMGEKKLK